MEASTNAVTLIAIATIVSGVNKSAKPVFSEKRPDERGKSDLLMRVLHLFQP